VTIIEGENQAANEALIEMPTAVKPGVHHFLAAAKRENIRPGFGCLPIASDDGWLMREGLSRLKLKSANREINVGNAIIHYK